MDVSQFDDLFNGDVFGGFGPGYWINNDLIYTTLLVRDRAEFGSKLLYSIPVILNPLTGSWEESLLSSQTSLNRKDEVGFSPDLQRVVFQGREIQLKDLNMGKELWSTDQFFLGIPDSKVRWSPNGNFVAVGKRYPDPKILLVAADGNHSEILPLGNIGGVIDFEWSPDSHYLMIYHSYGDTEKQFYVYDRIAQQIVLTCPVQQPWDVLFKWSPDSSQVIFGSYEGQLQILDIPSGRVAKLDIEDVVPTSWTSTSFHN